MNILVTNLWTKVLYWLILKCITHGKKLWTYITHYYVSLSKILSSLQILYIYHMPSHAISILSPTRLAELAKVSIFPEACRGLYRHFQSRGLPSFETVDIAWEGMWLMFYHTFFWAKFGLESRIWSNVGYESHQSKTRHVERIYVYIVQAINSSH